MARVTREIGAAWVKEAVMVLDGAAPSRHFWSRWMDRALAPHEGQMHRPDPIPANDVVPNDSGAEDDSGEEPSHMKGAELKGPGLNGERLQLLRFD